MVLRSSKRWWENLWVRLVQLIRISCFIVCSNFVYLAYIVYLTLRNRYFHSGIICYWPASPCRKAFENKDVDSLSLNNFTTRSCIVLCWISCYCWTFVAWLCVFVIVVISFFLRNYDCSLWFDIFFFSDDNLLTLW